MMNKDDKTIIEQFNEKLDKTLLTQYERTAFLNQLPVLGKPPIPVLGKPPIPVLGKPPIPLYDLLAPDAEKKPKAEMAYQAWLKMFDGSKRCPFDNLIRDYMSALNQLKLTLLEQARDRVGLQQSLKEKMDALCKQSDNLEKIRLETCMNIKDYCDAQKGNKKGKRISLITKKLKLLTTHAVGNPLEKVIANARLTESGSGGARELIKPRELKEKDLQEVIWQYVDNSQETEISARKKTLGQLFQAMGYRFGDEALRQVILAIDDFNNNESALKKKFVGSGLDDKSGKEVLNTIIFGVKHSKSLIRIQEVRGERYTYRHKWFRENTNSKLEQKEHSFDEIIKSKKPPKQP